MVNVQVYDFFLFDFVNVSIDHGANFIEPHN